MIAVVLHDTIIKIRYKIANQESEKLVISPRLYRMYKYSKQGIRDQIFLLWNAL